MHPQQQCAAVEVQAPAWQGSGGNPPVPLHGLLPQGILWGLATIMRCLFHGRRRCCHGCCCCCHDNTRHSAAAVTTMPAAVLLLPHDAATATILQLLPAALNLQLRVIAGLQPWAACGGFAMPRGSTGVLVSDAGLEKRRVLVQCWASGSVPA